jgi:hypothetical protein
MTITETVVEFVRSAGTATTAQVCEQFAETLTAKQVMKALSYAVSSQRTLVTTRKAIPGSSVIETTYRARTDDAAHLFKPNRSERERERPKYASVWDYAQGIEA